MASLSQEIQEIIRNNLPEQVGQALRQRLEQAEQDAAKVTAQANQIMGLNTRLGEVDSRLLNQRQLEEKANVLGKREANILERESKIEVFEAKLQVVESEKRAQLAKEIVSLVFRSPVYKKEVWSSHQVPSGQGYTNTLSDSSSETFKEE